MGKNLTHQLIESHLVSGKPEVGAEIGLRIDQTLTQDATGTLVMLELEAMGLARVRTELSVQYVDHNLLQEDYKNADDHLFLESACRRFGIWYSRPGNGVSHPVHQERFGVPGKTLLGSDSHTCAAGAIGMLAIGAGGLEVALAMAGQPFHVRMPAVFGVRLTGQLPPWVSAKDVILEMLRRHGVKGGVGRVIEYYGPGLAQLSAMDRHVIANMGAELGATATVFPSDPLTRRFFEQQGRRADWRPLDVDGRPEYELHDEIDLSQLEPLVAMPSSPDKVVPVREVAGQPIYQSYIGSSANPGFRDFAIVAEIVRGKTVHPSVSFDVNPTSRQLLAQLIATGHLTALIHAGARLHQAGCNGCIGMGQAPATGRLSVRTVPRNFPGRSGTRDDQVCLVSPETAAASALAGAIADPRELSMSYPKIGRPPRIKGSDWLFLPPQPLAEGQQVELAKGPNIVSLPSLEPLPDELELPVLLKMGDNISTDEILPAGSRVLPLRSNIDAISQFAFSGVDESYIERARQCCGRSPDRATGAGSVDPRTTAATGHAVVGGENYGQGSSREHAALAPRYLGLRLVLAKSFARIHWQNLVNFGVLPLTFRDPADYDRVGQGDVLVVRSIHDQLRKGSTVQIGRHEGGSFEAEHQLSQRQRDVLLTGGLIRWVGEHL